MKLLITLSALFISTFFLFMGSAIFINTSTLLLKLNNINDIFIGVVNSCFFIGAAGSAISANQVIIRVGHIRSFSFFAAILAACILTYTFFDNIYYWMLIRIIQGYSYYGILMVIESWINEKSESSIRAMVLGFYETIFFLSFVLSYLIIKIAIIDKKLFIYSAFLILIAVIPISLTKIKAPAIPQKEKIQLPKFKNIANLAIIGSFIGGFLVNGLMNMGLVYLLDRGFNLTQASYFMTITILGGFLIQLPMGKLSDHYGRRKALMITSLLSSIAMIINIIFNNHIIEYIAGFILGNTFCIYSLSLARANDSYSKNINMNVVEISRVILFSYGLGSLISPILLGIAMHYFNSYGFSILFFIFALFLFLFARSKRSIPKEERSIYVTIPTIGALNQLDPRQEHDFNKKENTNH